MLIHVDRRVGETAYQSFAEKIADLPDVTLAPRIACDWGTWSLVQASRDAAETLLKGYPDIGHVCLISGSCLPIKPVSELISYLAKHKDTDFIESVTIGDVPWTKGGLSEERFTLSFPFAWKRHRRLFDIWVDLQRRVGRKAQNSIRSETAYGIAVVVSFAPHVGPYSDRPEPSGSGQILQARLDPG